MTTEFSQNAADWESAQLGREEKPILLLMRNGLTVEQQKENGELRITRIETISEGKIDEDRVRFASGLSSEQVEKYRIRKNDILFSHINSDPHLGKTAIALKDYGDLLHGMNLLLLRPNIRFIDPQFLHFVCCYYRIKGVFVRICSRSVNQSSINQAKLKALEVPLPPLAEQRKIAGVLGLVQRAIEQQERLIALTAELKRRLMRKLFTQGLRGEPQKQTEIGLLPRSWDVRAIEELDLDIGDGNYSTKYPRREAFLKEGVPFIRANNLVDGRLVWNDMRYISAELHAELRKGHLKKNDVCLVTRGNIGELAFVEEEFVGANINAQLVRLNGGEAIDGRFLYFALTHPASQEQFKSLQTGTALQQLPLGKLKFLRVAVPPRDEQVEVAEVLWLSDQKRDAIRRKLGALNALFRTLLHHLMTAQIRVHYLDLSELCPEAKAEMPCGSI